MNNIYETKLAEYLNLATINPHNDDIKYKIIKYEQKLNQIGGANISKPIFVLFNGYGSSDLWFKYQYVSKIKLKKLSFYDELKKIGDVYSFTSNFFNLNYYYTADNKTEEKIQKKIIETYKPYTSNIDFNLEDLEIDVLCEKVYADVLKKFGKLNNRKLIVIGHSYGSEIGIHFTKMYKKHCLFCVSLDGSPHSLDMIKQQFNDGVGKKKKMLDSKFSNDTKLQQMLAKIKHDKDNNINVNKEIKLIFDLIIYKWFEFRLKHFIKKLPVPTLFFKPLHVDDSKTKNKFVPNKERLQEQNDIAKNNNINDYKFLFFLNAPHYLWFDQKISDEIIMQIKHMIDTIH